MDRRNLYLCRFSGLKCINIKKAFFCGNLIVVFWKEEVGFNKNECRESSFCELWNGEQNAREHLEQVGRT